VNVLQGVAIGLENDLNMLYFRGLVILIMNSFHCICQGCYDGPLRASGWCDTACR
jgi:hypothetical protein